VWRGTYHERIEVDELEGEVSSARQVQEYTDNKNVLVDADPVA
jgi:hypothetical protein